MGTTPIYAIPYVEPSDKLQAYPAADKAQALAVEAALGALTQPWAWVTLGSAQAVPSSTVTAVQFSSGTLENGCTLAAGLVTVPKDGAYLLSGSVAWPGTPNTTGARLMYLMIETANQNRIGAPPFAVSSQPFSQVAIRAIRLTAGQKVGVSVYQSSGVSISLDSTNYQCQFSVLRVSN